MWSTARRRHPLSSPSIGLTAAEVYRRRWSCGVGWPADPTWSPKLFEGVSPSLWHRLVRPAQRPDRADDLAVDDDRNPACGRHRSAQREGGHVGFSDPVVKAVGSGMRCCVFLDVCQTWASSDICFYRSSHLFWRHGKDRPSGRSRFSASHAARRAPDGCFLLRWWQTRIPRAVISIGFETHARFS